MKKKKKKKLSPNKCRYLFGFRLGGLEQVGECRAQLSGGVQQLVPRRLVVHQGRDHSHALGHLRQVGGDRGDGCAHRRVVHVVGRAGSQGDNLGSGGVHGSDLRANVLLVRVDRLLDPFQRGRIGAQLGKLGLRGQLGLGDVDHLVAGGYGRQ